MQRRGFKRHSLANVAEAWKGVTHGARRISSATSSSLRLHVNAGNVLDYASKNETLESVQIAVIQLFQRKKLQEGELPILQETLRKLIKTEAGPLIFDYYKDKLLRKGMVILREDMKNDLGIILLKKMSDQWQYFYTEIMPTLQVMLSPIQTKDTCVRKVTMLAFRDVVVLKVAIEETIRCVKKEEIPTAIKQMCLVLLSVHDGSPPTENYARLERLTAQIVTPYVGFFGLYEGSSTPKVKTTLKPASKHIHAEKTDTYGMDIRTARPRSAIMASKSSHIHSRHGNGLLFNKLLEPVVEQELSTRRHSIDT